MVRELDSTEEKIVSATFNIIQREGVSKATTKRIAKDAGVNEVTIFRKFENKKNLVEITKDYYFEHLIGQLQDVFDYTEEDTLESYLEKNFRGMLSLSDEDFSIIKIAMQEKSEVSEKKLLLSQITEAIMGKTTEFFTSQIEKGEMRDVNPRALSLLCFSVIFQSVVHWKIYNLTPDEETQKFGQNMLDILYNGINEN